MVLLDSSKACGSGLPARNSWKDDMLIHSFGNTPPDCPAGLRWYECCVLQRKLAKELRNFNQISMLKEDRNSIVSEWEAGGSLHFQAAVKFAPFDFILAFSRFVAPTSH